MEGSIRTVARPMLWLAAGLLISSVAAFGGERVGFFGLVFPEQVQEAVREETTDFESTRPGLGYSAVYSHRDWTANVYIYDLGRKEIPVGLASREIAEQFNQATRDVFTVGLYRDIVVEPRFTLSDRSGAQRFICGTFVYTHAQIGPAHSALCLTSWHNKFVKLRLTVSAPRNVSPLMRAFASDGMRILWPRG
jgi:hypothetical protein